jgi:hypothetical protein
VRPDRNDWIGHSIEAILADARVKFALRVSGRRLALYVRQQIVSNAPGCEALVRCTHERRRCSIRADTYLVLVTGLGLASRKPAKLVVARHCGTHPQAGVFGPASVRCSRERMEVIITSIGGAAPGAEDARPIANTNRTTRMWS